MINDALLGPVATELGWVPAPRYLMRRARVQALTRELKAGRMLEIGPGSGAMLLEFKQRGFDAEALELSAAARERSRALIQESGETIAIHEAPNTDWEGRFDLICAFEVLEHIEDDHAALALWRSWLKPGGTLLLSVPAHMKLWTARDEWAGHVRRYEDRGLRDVHEKAGLKIDDFECYGFPLTNLSEFVSSPIFARGIVRGGKDAGEDRQKNNDRSGVDRGADMKLFPLVRSMPGRLSLRFFFHVQTWFLKTDVGSGYIVKSRRA